MNKSKHILRFYILSLYLSILSCSSSSEELFVISNEERARMDDCWASAVANTSELSKVLIGEWRLEGYACGFCAPHKEPKGFIVFGEATGRIEIDYDEYDDQNIDFQWSTYLDTIERWTTAGYDNKIIARISTIPDVYDVSGSIICQNYLYHDDTALDGTMMLFKKS